MLKDFLKPALSACFQPSSTALQEIIRTKGCRTFILMSIGAKYRVFLKKVLHKRGEIMQDKDDIAVR